MVTMLFPALLLIATSAQTGVTEVPFRTTDDAIIVDGMVNGHPVSCVFDTGFAGTVILNDSIDIGKPTGVMNLRDFVGTLQASTVKLTSFKLGNKTIDPKDKEAVQQPMSRLTDGYGVHCDGLMGLSAIKDYVTEINFQKKKFIFYPKSTDITTRTPDNKKTFLAKMLMTGMSSIELTVVANTGKKMTMALDTGNAFYATTHKDVLQRVGLWGEQEAKFQKLSGVASGAVASWAYRMKDVNIYGVPVKESYWDIIDAPSSSAEGDGTVGFGFLQNFNITFDYDRRRVWLENWSGEVANKAPGDLGISAAYNQEIKRVMVYRVAPGSPADDAGIKAGDYLLSVGGADTGTLGFLELRKMMEGEVGSKVTVATSRSGVLTRTEITRKQLVNES